MKNKIPYNKFEVKILMDYDFVYPNNKIYPTIQSLLEGISRYDIIKYVQELNKIISNQEKLEKSFSDLVAREKASYIAYIEPIRNRYLNGLQRRGMFPKLQTQSYRTLLLNLIRCESHRDILKESLKR